MGTSPDSRLPQVLMYDREVSVEYPSGSVAVNWLLLKKSSRKLLRVLIPVGIVPFSWLLETNKYWS